MGDLKPIWSDAPFGNVGDLGGQLPTASGGDPLIDTGGVSGLAPVWPNPVVPVPGGSATPNSLSGLPVQPSRFAPSDQPPAPPTLQDHNPGTIDQK